MKGKNTKTSTDRMTDAALRCGWLGCLESHGAKMMKKVKLKAHDERLLKPSKGEKTLVTT